VSLFGELGHRVRALRRSFVMSHSPMMMMMMMMMMTMRNSMKDEEFFLHFVCRESRMLC